VRPDHTAAVAQWSTAVAAATGTSELPKLPDTVEIWDAPVERRWEAPARAGVVHAHYSTHYRLKGNELPEETGFRPSVPLYFRHTSRYAAFLHAQTMMRVRCSLTHLAGCVGRHAPPSKPRACRRCTGGGAETLEHVLLDCPATASLHAGPRYALLLARRCHTLAHLHAAPAAQLRRALLPRKHIHGAYS
jgi:hypothetical protein